MNLEFKKNQEYRITIDDMGKEGEGIGHVNGYALFVKGALMGEKVRVLLMKAKKQYGYARLLEVLEPSLHRTKPKCVNAGLCGGCSLQHMDYEGQLAFKEKKVRDCLIRIGGVNPDEVEWQPILGMTEDDFTENEAGTGSDGVEGTHTGLESNGAEGTHAGLGSDGMTGNHAGLGSNGATGLEEGVVPWSYRNKAQFPVRADEKGNPVTGFFAGRSHRLVPLEQCPIQHPVINGVLRVVMEFLQEHHISAYEEEAHRGLVRHIYIRRAHYTGQIMVCLVINGKSLPCEEAFVEALKEVEGMKSIYLNRNQKRTNVILGEKMELLWGADVIEDRIGGVKYQISPQSFYQVNPVQTEKLYRTALQFADLQGGEIIWDLYCGIGTISLFLARGVQKSGGRVVGVEIVPEAIENAKANAVLNGISNVEFYCGAAEEVVERLVRERKPEEDVAGKLVQERKAGADVVVVDPPRKGCDGKLLDTIVAMRPKKIVYVSCDPATLARDVKALGENGYAVRKVRACDMFPQGGHVETVVKLVNNLKGKLE